MSVTFLSMCRLRRRPFYVCTADLSRPLRGHIAVVMSSLHDICRLDGSFGVITCPRWQSSRYMVVPSPLVTLWQSYWVPVSSSFSSKTVQLLDNGTAPWQRYSYTRYTSLLHAHDTDNSTSVPSRNKWIQFSHQTVHMILYFTKRITFLVNAYLQKSPYFWYSALRIWHIYIILLMACPRTHIKRFHSNKL